MTEAQPQSYHEALIERLDRPFIADCPAVYEPNQALIEATNRGEFVSQITTFDQYFTKLAEGDADYMRQIDRMVRARGTNLPGSVDINRRLQFIVPAYREGENIGNFLQAVKKQGEATTTSDWGVTFVIDHAVPYKNPYETGAVNKMRDEIDAFIEQNPDYKGRIDHVFYTRRANTKTPILPVGLARKVGEDVVMYERLLAAKRGEETTTPLYLGQIDIDSSTLTPGLFTEITETLPETEDATPRIIRVRGSFDKEDVKANPHLHALQMMWEGTTSQVGTMTNHNPFTIGRLSVIPARELAMTGGGFAKKLPFPDEDIRRGIQAKWHIQNIDTVEVNGKYSTSARRELQTMNGLRQLVADKNGAYDDEVDQVASLRRMYGSWAQHTFRNEFGNIINHLGTEMNPESLSQILPPKLIEYMANAFYGFTALTMFSVDGFADSLHTPEIATLKTQYLRGELAYFQVQIQAREFLYRLQYEDPQRFATLEEKLRSVNTRAQQAIANILGENGVAFSLEDTGIPFGTRALTDTGETLFHLPFRIHEDQSGYMRNIKQQIDSTA